MIQGFIDGIKAMASKVSDAVSGVIDGAKDFIGFNSPAEKGEGRNIVKWGANFIDGFLDGVDSMKPEVGFAMNDIVGSMKPTSGGGAAAPATIGRGAFEGAIIMDDYGVDRLMDRIMERLSALGVK
jgi:phage-related protein